MTDLFEKSIQILELPKVLERLAGPAVTQEGKERCLALRPMTDPDDDLGSAMPDGDSAPGDGSENNAAANGPTGGQNDTQTDAGSGARNLPADGRADTASGRPGQLVRGTGTADMVTGDTPATDRGASRTAPGPQAA